jgi:FdhD protein
VTVDRVRPSGLERAIDHAATEEPMEIRLHGDPFAVVMRTPGADVELTAGFLWSERAISTLAELGTIARCADGEVWPGTGPAPGPAARENVVNVTLVGVDVAARLADRRRVLTNASCGVCGRLTLESLRADAPAITARWSIDAGVLGDLPRRLREGQAIFDQTGGLHAAGLFSPDGTLITEAEDIGRHNAVDKVVGRMLLAENVPLAEHVLVVSGRASFEIVQKAFLAGIPIVAAVSAASSLAIDLAHETGITLVGFLRGSTFNVYANGWRIEKLNVES